MRKMKKRPDRLIVCRAANADDREINASYPERYGLGPHSPERLVILQQRGDTRKRKK